MMFRFLRKSECYFLRYEVLATDPEEALGALMSWLGKQIQTSQFDLTKCNYHAIGGNRMRRAPKIEIELDDQWRLRLSLTRRFLISAFTWPAFVFRVLPIGPRTSSGRRQAGT